jgi:TonB family protein
MIAKASLAAALVLAWAYSAQAQSVVVNPDWLRKPTAEELAAAWPAEATKQGVTQGRVIIACSVMVDGKLSDCVVKEETPPGAGLAAAALGLAETMRMRPRMVDGHAVEGARVTIPVNFVKPAGHAAVVTNPEWLRKPTFDQLMAVFPAKANGASGLAVIKCIVKTDGLVRACTIQSEKPEGRGFGYSALALAPTFLFKPRLRDGQPVEAEVSIPINFEAQPVGATSGQSITVVTTPMWDKTPTIAEILAELDKKVGDKFADGKVAFQCTVSKNTGHLSDCITINSSPGMAGFTPAARVLTSKFEVDKQYLAAAKNEVRVNLAFSFPDMQSEAWSKRYILHPVWLRTVSPDPSQPLFPEDAAKAGLKTGAATVDCVLSASGALTNCDVVSESTPGLGFGDMAKKIAEVFVANPWTEDGLPADGAHVRMPIRMDYAPPADAPAPAPAAKP